MVPEGIEEADDRILAFEFQQCIIMEKQPKKIIYRSVLHNSMTKFNYFIHNDQYRKQLIDLNTIEVGKVYDIECVQMLRPKHLQRGKLKADWFWYDAVELTKNLCRLMYSVRNRYADQKYPRDLPENLRDAIIRYGAQGLDAHDRFTGGNRRPPTWTELLVTMGVDTNKQDILQDMEW